MKSLAKFSQTRKDRHTYAREWKERTGGKVVGYFCTYVPEEIMYAAGILPVRIYGSHESSDVTETHVTTQWCPFSRDCLAQGLEGRYDYLDGLVISNSCYHIMQTYDIWQRHRPTAFKHYMWAPHFVGNPRACDCFARELGAFKSHLEEWSGRTVTDAELDKSIEVYNTNRRLLGQVYELRKNAPPVVSGAEAMSMVLAASVMDKEEHSKLLRDLLKELPTRKTGPDDRVRLMLEGSETDDIEFIEFIESLGAVVVTDDHCSGSRYFWNEVVPQEDRLSAIASRYLGRPPCPQKDYEGEPRRWPHILKLARDYNAQGVIILLQKFCDPHLFDLPLLQEFLTKNNLPNLFLESDIANPGGQFRTRIEAFLETIQME